MHVESFLLAIQKILNYDVFVDVLRLSRFTGRKHNPSVVRYPAYQGSGQDKCAPPGYAGKIGLARRMGKLTQDMAGNHRIARRCNRQRLSPTGFLRSGTSGVHDSSGSNRKGQIAEADSGG